MSRWGGLLRRIPDSERTAIERKLEAGSRRAGARCDRGGERSQRETDTSEPPVSRGKPLSNHATWLGMSRGLEMVWASKES